MNDPRNEIVGAVKALTLSSTVASQRTAINKYFAADAGFSHPLCTVQPGPSSRDAIAGIYEWYRDMSPDISLEVESFVYDETQKVAYLNVVQTFHIFLSPFKPAPARLLVKVELRRNEQDGKYYIIQQSDYYQPEDILRLVIPFLATPLVYIKRLASTACGINATAFGYARYLAHQGTQLFSSTVRQVQAQTQAQQRRVGDHMHQE